MPTPEKQNRLGRISNRPLGGVLWYAGSVLAQLARPFTQRNTAAGALNVHV